MTHLPFAPDQIVTLLVLFAGVILAYAEIKFIVKDIVKRQTKAELDIAKLEDGAVSAALLKQTLENVQHEVKNLRMAATAMNNFMIRASVKLGMEHHDV